MMKTLSPITNLLTSLLLGFSLILISLWTLSAGRTLIAQAQGNLPVAGFGAEEEIGLAPFTVTLFNGSLYADSYLWDYGDGTTSTIATISHTHFYATPGSYTVTLTATNALASDVYSRAPYILVYGNLAIDFTATPLTGTVPFSVAFTNLSQNATHRVWEFGDGTTSQDVNPVHTYNTSGVFSVTLWARNPATSYTPKTKSSYITAYDMPIEGLSVLNDSPTELGRETILTATVITGTSVNYTWDFGDGEVGSGTIISHSYPATGTYTAAVTASNTVSELTATTTVTIIDDPCFYPLSHSGFEDVDWIQSWIIDPNVARVSTPKFSGFFSLLAPSFDSNFHNPWFYQKIQMPGWILSNTTTIDLSVYRYVDQLGDSNSQDKFNVALLEAPDLSSTIVATSTEPVATGDGVNKVWNRNNISLQTAPGINLEDYEGQDLYLYFYNNTNAEARATTGNCPPVSSECGTTKYYFDDVELKICVNPASAPSLTLAKTAPEIVTIGHPITYTLTITNSGNLTATNLLITDVIPTGANYVNGGDRVGNVVSWTMASLPANASAQVSFIVTATHPITNSNYNVTADGGYSATGQIPIVTSVTDDETIPPDGGTVTPSPSITIAAGIGVFSETVLINHTPQSITHTGTLSHVGLFYELSATYLSSGLLAQPQPGKRYTITVTYQQENVPIGLNEVDLGIYYWNGNDWIREPTSKVDVEVNTVSAMPNHFSLWAVLGSSQLQIYLPVILKP